MSSPVQHFTYLFGGKEYACAVTMGSLSLLHMHARTESGGYNVREL